MSENCPKKAIAAVQEKVEKQIKDCESKIATLDSSISETTTQMQAVQDKSTQLTEADEAKVKDIAAAFKEVNVSAIVESITTELSIAKMASINSLNETINTMLSLKESYKNACEPLDQMKTDAAQKAAQLLAILDSAKSLDTQTDSITERFSAIEKPVAEVETVLVADQVESTEHAVVLA